jgi:hypothetical protein
LPWFFWGRFSRLFGSSLGKTPSLPPFLAVYWNFITHFLFCVGENFSPGYFIFLFPNTLPTAEKALLFLVLQEPGL